MGAYLAIKSKNILPYPYKTASGSSGGVTYTINSDGSITLNGTCTATASIRLYDSVVSKTFLKAGETYTAYLKGAKNAWCMYIHAYYIPTSGSGMSVMGTTSAGNPKTFTATNVTRLYIDLNILTSAGTFDNLTVYPIIAEGAYTAETMPAYEPYYTYKRVKAFGRMVRNPKNLIPFPYVHWIGSSGTTNGVNYVINNDGSITLNGTPTATTGIRLFQDTFALEEGKTYTLYLKNAPKYQYMYLHLIHNPEGSSAWVSHATTSVGNPITFTYTKGSNLRADINILTYIGKIDNLTVYPMLVEGSYTASTMPNYFVPTKCTIRMRPTTFPEQYQRVEYIESTGTQYIDTGVIGKSPITAETKMCWTALSSDAGFLGARTDLNGTRRFYPFYQYPNATWNIGYKENQNTGATIVANTDYVLKSVLTKGKQEFYVNGVKVWSGTGDFEVNTEYPMRLFGYYKENEDTTKFNAKARLYYLKIYDGDKLVRDFIPCYRKGDGKIGLFDIVRGVFYTNQGTGTFIKGADV